MRILRAIRLVAVLVLVLQGLAASAAALGVEAGPDQSAMIGGAVPWTPAQLATVAWVDAADTGTFSGVGGAVSEWRDKSGHGRHLVQSEPSKQPSRRLTLTGTRFVSFNAASSQELGNTAFVTGTQQLTILAVYRYNTVNSGARILSLRRTEVAGGQLDIFSFGAPSGDRAGYRFPTNANVAGDATDTELRLIGYTTSGNNSQKLYKNGAFVAERTSTVTPFTSEEFYLGSQGGSAYASADLHEVVVLDGVSDQERTKLEGYLAHKWGLAAALPENHPYKVVRPMVSPAAATVGLAGVVSGGEGVPDLAWSVVSGPGEVDFSDASSAQTTATFYQSGEYVLRLTADDGSAAAFDEVAVTVQGPKVYDVYFIAGQSNADGRGLLADLAGDLAEFAGPEPGVRIFYTNPLNSDPWNPTHLTGWRMYEPGYSVAPGFSGVLPSASVGFDVSLVRALKARNPDGHIAIIKIARGGTNLQFQWRTFGGNNNFMWQTFVNQAQEAMDALAADGSQLNVRGMFWHQGESDGNNANYQTHLADLIATTRAFLGRPDLPFVIGELERDGVHPNIINRDYQLNAMAAVAEADPHTLVVSSVGLLTDDGTHFTSRALVEFGQRLGRAFHDVGDGVTHSVFYAGNGATGGSVPVEAKGYRSFGNVTIADGGALEKDGYIFTGWNTQADGNGQAYAAGDLLVITGDVTLHAQWAAKQSPEVTEWPTAATITEGQPLSAAQLGGGGASVPGFFSFANPATIPPAGEYLAVVVFTPEDSANYSTASATVIVTVRTAFAAWVDEQGGGSGITFGGDANNDGVPDGLAWLLGAPSLAASAVHLLPVPVAGDGTVSISFLSRAPGARGTSAILRLQHRTSLTAGSWTDVLIPPTSATVDGVQFTVTPVPGSNLDHIKACVSAGTSTQFYMRLAAESASD